MQLRNYILQLNQLMPTELVTVAGVLEIPIVHENWHVGRTEVLIAVFFPTAEEKTAKRDH